MHVVAGLLVTEPGGAVLLARRAPGSHQGGLWEFPGGKLEPGEDERAALGRELGEELGIEVLEAEPLIRITHDYPDRRVLLALWRVRAWRGTPRGREGQPLAWVAPGELAGYPMPAADRPLVAAALGRLSAPGTGACRRPRPTRRRRQGRPSSR